MLFTPAKKSKVSILIRSNQTDVLDGFHNYSNFVENFLNTNYVIRAKSELKLIEKRFGKLSAAGTDNNIIQTLLSIDRFIDSIETGGHVLIIQKPTIPIKSSLGNTLLLALSVVLGGMIGAVLVLVRSAIAKRQDQLTKAN